MVNYDLVEKLVIDARQIVFNHTNSMNVKMKGDADFVTDIDIDISNFIKNELAVICPESGFFSEEEDGALMDDCWILDPIDGTTNLVYGYNMSSISLAHYLNGEIVFGIVYNPFNGEIFTARKGEGAYLNRSVRLQVSDRPIEKSLIEFGAGSTHKENADENFALVTEIFKHCVDVRRICSSALVMCYIAAGRLDGYFEKVLKPWDIAAGHLILSEAGGVTTDYSGNPITFSEKTSVIASNGVIQEFLKSKIAEYQ